VSETSDRNLALQLGAEPPAGGASCETLSAALRFQPQVVAVFAVLGGLFRSPAIFALLALALVLGAIAPRWNPFDALYHRTLGAREGAPRLAPAAPPRRFAQGMAATFAAAIALCLWTQHDLTASVLWVFMLVALASIALGRMCLGSFVYHLLSGRRAFALGTLPWSK
jgi:hypothetical protein